MIVEEGFKNFDGKYIGEKRISYYGDGNINLQMSGYFNEEEICKSFSLFFPDGNFFMSQERNF